MATDLEAVHCNKGAKPRVEKVTEQRHERGEPDIGGGHEIEERLRVGEGRVGRDLAAEYLRDTLEQRSVVRLGRLSSLLVGLLNALVQGDVGGLGQLECLPGVGGHRVQLLLHVDEPSPDVLGDVDDPRGQASCQHRRFFKSGFQNLYKKGIQIQEKYFQTFEPTNFLGLIKVGRQAQNFKQIAQPIWAFQELSVDQKMSFLRPRMSEI